ncbi:hypothetical protein [Candidatus Marithrix sp. Canyon 246]|uniref:hypothetical protein n=1 Tax=Candidatus Marithrix sp. Canyon 246 TaxID=1827136 RepID=UPI00084A1B0B|nr:hypothetical protein [Candidatus Marithrix sp. Canyon 246]
MITIREEQMDALNLAYYRRQCVKFVKEELQLFDYIIPEQEIQSLFEQFYPLIDIKNRDDRLTLILLMLASLAFHEIYTQQAIMGFMDKSMTSGDRRNSLQHMLLEDVGYNSEFLYRKSWI